MKEFQGGKSLNYGRASWKVLLNTAYNSPTAQLSSQQKYLAGCVLSLAVTFSNKMHCEQITAGSALGTGLGDCWGWASLQDNACQVIPILLPLPGLKYFLTSPIRSSFAFLGKSPFLLFVLPLPDT